MNRNDDPDSDGSDVDRLPRPDALDGSVNPRLIRLTKAGDSLASFGTETGADPPPGEPPADAAPQQGPAASAPPIPARGALPAARSVPFVTPPATEARGRGPIFKVILWSMLVAAAVFIGVALGSIYARYLSPKPVDVAGRGPAVTEPDTSAAPEPVPDTGAPKATSPLAPPAPPSSKVSPPKSTPARPGVPATRPERDRPANVPPAIERAVDRSSATVLPPSTVAELPAVPLKTPAAVLPPSTVAPLPTVPSTAASASAEEPTSGERERLAVADERTIRTILDAYRVAYERLDVVAASTLWPGVDTRALTRAFGTLASQRMAFERCDIAVTGAQARARCDGAITYTRRVGVAQPQSRRMSWTFALDRSSGQWRISDVDAR